ncbi:hypothetical protein HIU99_17105 [Marinobacter sp. W62]|uniref:Uncharacterized protein n=1 Tax=Marinobacter orientalis TaxID=1928859 RepID=A0A7Y0WTV5_9GAMM|nr:hypothetical protein [Marinobacter orientalis]
MKEKTQNSNLSFMENPCLLYAGHSPIPALAKSYFYRRPSSFAGLEKNKLVFVANNDSLFVTMGARAWGLTK